MHILNEFKENMTLNNGKIKFNSVINKYAKVIYIYLLILSILNFFKLFSFFFLSLFESNQI